MTLPGVFLWGTPAAAAPERWLVRLLMRWDMMCVVLINVDPSYHNIANHKSGFALGTFFQAGFSSKPKYLYREIPKIGLNFVMSHYVMSL